MTEIVNIFKAQPTGDFTVGGATISINETIPNSHTLEAGMKVFEAQAEKLERALYKSLPGGTYDQLLVVMLRRKASHFVVSHAE